MASLNTSGNQVDVSSPKMSTHGKLNQIKNPPQPLRFRSFDAFYQHYSKKQTYDNSQHRTPLNQTPIHNTTLKDKKESTNSDHSQESEDLKPTFTYTTEDYDIKGRVKRLCEIFQKAHSDANFRIGLESVISKNRNFKSVNIPITPRTNLNSVSKLSTNVGSSIEPDFKGGPNLGCDSTGSDLGTQKGGKQNTHVQIYTKRDQNTRPTVNLSPLKAKPDLISGSEEAIFNIDLNSVDLIKGPVPIEGRPDVPSPKAASPTKSSSFKYISPTKTTSIRHTASIERSLVDRRSVLSNDQSTGSTLTQRSNREDMSGVTNGLSNSIGMEEITAGMENLGLKVNRMAVGEESSRISQISSVDFGRRDSDVSARVDNEALIDDILNRFIHDPEFCDTFFNKLETFNSTNKSATLQFSKIIDELQFLVENDNLNCLESEDQKKSFEWFFNQPKVFDFNVTEHGSYQVFTSIEHSEAPDNSSLVAEESTPRTRDDSKVSAVPIKLDTHDVLTVTQDSLDDVAGNVDESSALGTSGGIDMEDDDPTFGELNPEMAKHFDWIKNSN